MKKEFLVSLDIYSDSLTLLELSSALGRKGDEMSHDKSDIQYRRKSFDSTVWTLESKCPKELPIEKHLKHLSIEYPADELLRLLPQSCNVQINVGVLFDPDEIAAVGVNLTAASIRIANEFRADVVIRCYPTSDYT